MLKEQKAKIGLEIHGYLQTKEKLFCRCKAVRHTAKQQIKPNSFICPICTSQPGCKPMLPNSKAIRKIIEIALMLNCKINTLPKTLVWNRKHYSWPDLPKGYQDTISGAYSVPVAEQGVFEKIKIRECHLEEDPASWNPETGCIDYNRSGLPLIEIVTEPDFQDEQQVANWLNELILTLSYIKAVDKNAGIKADVNISTKKTNFKERVEIKNLSSIENIKKAISAEIARQQLEEVKRETRTYNPEKDKTILMRTKETEEDYRFIPDPDLPIIKLTSKEVEEIKKQLPETPKEKLEKLIRKHKLSKQQAEILYRNFELVEFFEKIAEKINPEFAIHWITIELNRVLNYAKKTLDEVNIEPEHFLQLLKAVKNKEITELKAKQILNEFIPKSFSIKQKIKSSGAITDKKQLKKIVDLVINKNKQAVQDYKSGNKSAFNFLIGEIMKESKKRADFKLARELLEKMLK
jgi:aspartyl-tRNA(Asn)/glutamyl-tRNA(Gln) amidotransferase subunit B